MRYLLVEAVVWSIILMGVLMWGIDHGTKQGRKDALRTNPPSDELEMTCAGLWIGEQNKKAWEKDRARKH